MTPPHRFPFLPILIVILTGVIFFIDAFTPLDIAIAVMYVVVVLLAAARWSPHVVLVVTALCLGLTGIAYIVAHGWMYSENPFARFTFSVIAISTTAFLAIKGQRATARLLQREEALQQAQAQLAHVTRVTMLGELAASIAHEVNQPLAAIATNGAATLRWLNRPRPDLAEARAAIDNIINDTGRASEVIKRVRALARKSDPQYLGVDLNEVVNESVALVQREISRNGVQLHTTLADTPLPVQADRIQLQQVIINLLVNAMQAMTAHRSSTRIVSLRTAMAANDEVLLEVSDTGPGIDAVHVGRLFEAFYTTKAEGMGMGLSICRSIIESHGGRIWLDAGRSPGATLCFALPMQTEEG